MNIDEIVKNKATLIAQKKATMKQADGVAVSMIQSELITKEPEYDGSVIQVKAVINTTNLMDSHNDVHFPGLWTKSLGENRMIMHLQEHSMKFDKIISDGTDLIAHAETYTWEQLGYKYPGSTQALVFDSTIKAERNSFMMNQYKKGNVKNHSVGMQYVKLLLAVNDPQYGVEFEAWEKYYPMIANKEAADAEGFFWAVTEAKVIEGSAVPLGSNFATPTLEIKEPSKDTQQSIEPPEGTQITVKEFKNEFKKLFK